MGLNKPIIYSKNRFRLKLVLAILALTAILVGAVILIRAFFIENNFIQANNNESIAESIQNAFFAKPPTKQSKNFIETNSSFPPIATNERTWLKIKSSQKIYIGYLDKNLKFITKYSISSTASNINLLTDESLAYIDDNKIIVQKNSNKTEIVLLENAAILSLFYSPVDENFYYINANNDESLTVAQINFNGTSVDLYNTFNIPESVKILNVDADNIYLQADNTCYSLIIFSKELKEINCLSIKVNSSSALYYTNSYIQQQYTPLIKESINVYDQSKAQSTKLFEAQNAEMYSNGFLLNKDIYFVKSIYINNSFIQNLIISYNLDSKVIKEVTPNLPNIAVSDIFVQNEKMFAVTTDASSARIFYYTAEPLSFPASYPGSSSSWVNVDLGIGGVEEVELLMESSVNTR